VSRGSWNLAPAGRFCEDIREQVVGSGKRGAVFMKLFSQLIVASEFWVLLMTGSCNPSPERLVGHMILTENIEDFAILAHETSTRGDEAIPIFLAVLNRHVYVTGSPLELDKTYWCLVHLRDLARQGIYNRDEVPTLIRVTEDWHGIFEYSVIPAETLKLITGVDVGYDEAFVERYTEADEPERQQMIAAWRDWYVAEAGWYPE
jgi:hypothetical protein